MKPPRSVARRTLLLGGVSLLAMRAGPASAHAHLKAATPAAGSTVSGKIDGLELTFSEPLEVAFSRVEVRAADGHGVETGRLAAAPGRPSVLLVPFAEPLRTGRYTVDWHATATDTHKTQGRYEFVVAP